MKARPSVRRVVPEDAETILTLVAEIAAHQSQGGHVTADAARWRTMLGRADVVVLLAEDEGQALGYVSAVRRLHLRSGSDVIGLDDLYVRPAHRSRGVGRVLMEPIAPRGHPLTAQRSTSGCAMTCWRSRGADDNTSEGTPNR